MQFQLDRVPLIQQTQDSRLLQFMKTAYFQLAQKPLTLHLSIKRLF
ncbi:hypothetical protein ADIAL_0643 [Alkalibacterium sp. AK22]|nr:hypothetical protein ADIAL_0643 [Alkalibacterium sp. AK22]